MKQRDGTTLPQTNSVRLPPKRIDTTSIHDSGLAPRAEGIA